MLVSTHEKQMMNRKYVSYDKQWCSLMDIQQMHSDASIYIHAVAYNAERFVDWIYVSLRQMLIRFKKHFVKV